VPEHIRPLDCRVATIVAAGLARSEIFSDLVGRIGRLNGIVYVMPGRVFMVHARLAFERWTDASHDLARFPAFQHAIEVLSSTASTEAEIDALFERIGIPVGHGVTETNAAITVQRTIGRELSALRDRSLGPR